LAAIIDASSERIWSFVILHFPMIDALLFCANNQVEIAQQ
jgi:hypothetical protein